MRLSKTTWLVIAIVVFVICAIVLYMFYQNQMSKRQEAKDELSVVQDTSLMLLSQKSVLETELVEKENELTQWEDTIDQLNEQINQSETELAQIQKGFPDSAESIEYDETLFSFALGNNVQLFSVSASELGVTRIADIDYGTVTFDAGIRGEVEDLLHFINTVVNDSDFRTAILEPVTVTIPDPLDDEEVDNLEQTLRNQLTAEALVEIPTADIVVFTLEAIDEVAGDTYIDMLTGGSDGRLSVKTLTEMAATIKERIADSIYLETEVEEPLAVDLAELIEVNLPDPVINKVVNEITAMIEDLIITKELVEGEEQVELNDLIDLVGPDLAALIPTEIVNTTESSIPTILLGYIAGLIEGKMLDSFANSVQDAIENTMPGIIEEAEMPSASMTIMVYIYQSGGE